MIELFNVHTAMTSAAFGNLRTAKTNPMLDNKGVLKNTSSHGFAYRYGGRENVAESVVSESPLQSSKLKHKSSHSKNHVRRQLDEGCRNSQVAS